VEAPYASVLSHGDETLAEMSRVLDEVALITRRVAEWREAQRRNLRRADAGA
jgi:hypothetical protein